MVTKLSKVLAAMDAGDWRKAFSIASKFGNLGKQAERIMRAQSAINNPDFYRQIGRNPEIAIEEGEAAMRERFGPMRNRSCAG